jgi:hypothetical protein
MSVCPTEIPPEITAPSGFSDINQNEIIKWKNSSYTLLPVTHLTCTPLAENSLPSPHPVPFSEL